MRCFHTTPSHWRDERGFTLIETLVATLSAVVVVGALYAILIVALDQTSKVTNIVQATQDGRTTMTKIVDELQSACISSGFTPVEAGSNESKLIFVNAYSKTAEIATAYKHELIWEKSTGKLIEHTYTSNGGSWPNFTFPTTHTETRLGEDISETELEKKSIPIFQYYKYATKASSASANEALSALEKKSLGGTSNEKELTGTEAEEAAAVEISFKQAPLDKETTESRAVDLKNQVTLAFSVPNAETPIADKPCE